MPPRVWDEGQSAARRRVVALTAALMMVLTFVSLVAIQDNGASPLADVATSTPADLGSVPTQPVVPSEPANTAQTATASGRVPHALIGGWTLTSLTDPSPPPQASPRAFQTDPSDLTSAGYVVRTLALNATVGWDPASDWEELVVGDWTAWMSPPDERTGSVTAGMKVDADTVVLVSAVGLERVGVIAVLSIAVGESGEINVTTLARYTPLPDAVVGGEYNSAVFENGGGNATVRVWAGGGSDILALAFDRVAEAISVYPIDLAGSPGLAADLTSDGGSRVFLVGGRDGYTIEVDLQLPAGADREEIRGFAASLRLVGQRTFEAAATPDMITQSEWSAIVADMLADVPLPFSFDEEGLSVTGDRYHAGASATGAVVCAWITEWVRAREEGDQPENAVQPKRWPLPTTGRSFTR